MSLDERNTLTDLTKSAKNSIYEKIMDAETNILTAPIKLLAWMFHELFNPHSFFRQHALVIIVMLLMFAIAIGTALYIRGDILH
jgi:hypothetical protein